MTMLSLGKTRWTTSSASDSTETLPMELSALGAHVDHCKQSVGRWFLLRCAVDTVHAFIAPRFVTSVVILGLVFGISALVF